jgi:hypothetical protein
MNFYYDSLGEDGYIEVFHQHKLFLKVKLSNYFLHNIYNIQKAGKLIFKSRLLYLPFWQKVAILYQDLPEPIEEISSISWKEYELYYANTVLSFKRHGLFKKRMWKLYKNSFEIGYIEWAKAVSIGGKYNISIDDEDETINTCFLILFVTTMLNT